MARSRLSFVGGIPEVRVPIPPAAAAMFGHNILQRARRTSENKAIWYDGAGARRRKCARKKETERASLRIYCSGSINKKELKKLLYNSK